MAVTFGTPVITAILASQTAVAFALSGVTSGQPIVVIHTNFSGDGASSITDTFSTHYTWILLESSTPSQSGLLCEMWLGTGGAGTSGTATINVTSSIAGGAAVPCVGASTAAGTGAVDVKGVTTSGGSALASPAVSPSLTPGAAGEGAIYACQAYSAATGPTSPWTSTPINYGAVNYGSLSLYPSPPSGSALQTSWSYSSNQNWGCPAVIMKAAAAVTPTSGMLMVL